MREVLKDYKLFNIDAKKLRSKEFYKNVLEYRRACMEKYKHALKKSAEFTCPLCNHNEGKDFLSLNDYKLKECGSCGLVSPNIHFNKINQQEMYADPDNIKDVKREILDTYDYRKNTYAPERLQYLKEKIKDIKHDEFKILDVGCGPGYFLDHLKDKGISYKGIELTDFLVQIAKNRGLNATKTQLEDEPNGSYNCITLFDVIEHLTSPIDFFKTLNQKLEAGGYVLAYTPNIHSMAFYLMKENQNTLYPYQHVCFFDQNSLNYLAEKTGFLLQSIDYFGLDIIDYFCWREYEDQYQYLEKIDAILPALQAVLDKSKLSNHQRIIFKKIY